MKGNSFTWIKVYTEFPLLSKQIFNENLPEGENENDLLERRNYA
jgi:hypothetical protein